MVDPATMNSAVAVVIKKIFVVIGGKRPNFTGEKIRVVNECGTIFVVFFVFVTVVSMIVVVQPNKLRVSACIVR